MAAPGAPSGLLSARADGYLFSIVFLVFVADACALSLWTATSQQALAAYERPYGDVLAAAAFVLLVLYTACNAPSAVRAISRNWLAMSVACFAIASSAWSYDSATSFRAGLNLAGAVLFILTAVERASAFVALQRAFAVLTFVVLVNALALALPHISFMSGEHAGAFRGFTNHKNTLGPLIASHFVLLLGLSGAGAAPNFTRTALAALAILDLALLGLTRCSTAIAVGVAAFILFLVLRGLRRFAPDLRSATLALLAAACAALLALAPVEHLAAALGRDGSFSGRGEIWAFSLQLADMHSAFGWGYKALPLAEYLAAVPRADGWQRFVVGTTHSSYIEIYATLGAAGFALYAALITARLWRIIATPSGNFRDAALLLAFAYLAAGVTETFSGLFAGLSLALFLIATGRPVIPGRAASAPEQATPLRAAPG